MSEENTKSTDEQVENSSIEKPAEDLPVIKETTEEAIPAQELPKQPSEPDPLPEEIIFDMDEVAQEDGYTLKERTDMEAKYTETMKIFRSGELVTGKIVAITDSDIAVDIGFKSEGSIPVEEFENLNSLKVGDDIEVLIDSIEDDEGTLALSKKKAEFTRVWENINNLYQSGEMVEAQIVRRIKGGMVVDLFSVEAFLPGSQIDVHPVRDFDALVNISMDFRIIKVNNARKNVVLSHKVLVEESLREIREKVLSEIEEGQVVEGVVKNITDFGVFVDLGGVDGLLHITDLSWGRVSHPSDVVKLDEKIKTKVLRYDKEKQRISLGLKQLKEQHWDEIEEKYPVGGKIKGKVVSLVKYGAFIEIEEGIEGLVHISEMSWTQHIKHPSQMVSVGDEIDIVVLNVDRESRKISLGMKQCEEDPWERLEQVFKRGTRHKGIVRDLVPFGAFVELEPNIDGLIHISDLSWVRKVRHPGEIVKKGEEIEVTILNFDRNERRIALGLKQLEPDPWDRFEKEYPIRARSEGSVVRVLEKGVVVMLPLGVEGFIPNSQLGRSLAGENKKQIKEGDNLELEVIEFDKVNHRIVLSHAIIERGREKTVYRAYKDTSAEVKTTIGDIMRDSNVVTDIKKPISPKEEPEKVVEVQSESEVTKPVIEDVDVIVDETEIKAASEEEVAVEVTPEVPVEAEVVDAEIITEPVKDETGEEKEAVVARGKAKATIEEAEAKFDEKKAEVPTEEAKAEVVEEKVEAKVDDEKAKAKVTKDKAEEDTVPDTVKVEAPVDEEKKKTDKAETKPKRKPETKAKVTKTKTKKKTTSTSVKPKAKAKKKTEAATKEDKEKVKTVKSKPKTVKKKVEKDEKAEAKPKTKAKITKTKDEGKKTKEPE